MIFHFLKCITDYKILKFFNSRSSYLFQIAFGNISLFLFLPVSKHKSLDQPLCQDETLTHHLHQPIFEQQLNRPSISRPPTSGDAASSSPPQISPSVSCRRDEPATTYHLLHCNQQENLFTQAPHEPFVPPQSQSLIVAPRFATTISTKPSHCETCWKSQQDHLATTESRVIHRLPRTTSKPTSQIAGNFHISFFLYFNFILQQNDGGREQIQGFIFDKNGKEFTVLLLIFW